MSDQQSTTAYRRECAEILVEHRDRDGKVVEVPDFGFPPANLFQTDEERYYRLVDAAERAEIEWSERHRATFLCSADRSRVTTTVVGTSWYRQCATGRHRWQRSFGPDDQWLQIQ